MRDSKPDKTWSEQFKKTLASFVDRGDYKGALPYAERALKDYPDDFYVRFSYAKILGDWADELPGAQKAKLKKKSIAILRPLVRSAKSQPVEVRFRTNLNLYYQSEDWKGMYQFGRRFARTDRNQALYAEGLGATLLAFELDEGGNSKKAKTWAKKAIAAWEKYDLKKDRYYFPTYNYAKALALAGQSLDAMKALKRAAKLGKRPVTDWEFTDVLRLLHR